MSMEDEWSSQESGDIETFLRQLSSSQCHALAESVNQLMENGGEILLDDLQGMKESKEAEQPEHEGGISVMSYSPHGVADLPQLIAEDQSLFSDLSPNDSFSSHNHQPFKRHDITSESSDARVFWANLELPETGRQSPEALELYHPVETVVVDDWRPASVHGFETGSPGKGKPTSASVQLGDILDSGGTFNSPPRGCVVSQPSGWDRLPFSVHPSKRTVHSQEISQTTMNQSQVVKVEECGGGQWPTASGVQMGEGDLEDARKERRRMQNRTAARKCRNRKKESFESMAMAAQKLKLENVELQKSVIRLRAELNGVMELVKLHETHCGLQLTISQPRRPGPVDPR